MKSYIVIGLGRFGTSVAEQLCELGNEVLVIDSHSENVQRISSLVTSAVIGDARDLDMLCSLDAGSFDCAIVAVGTDLASNILITLNLKELGVPYVLCKAQNEMQKRALEKIGADNVVIPEREIGVKLAQKLTSASVLDFIELSPEYGIAEVSVLNDWVGKTILDLGIRAKYGLNIIAVKRGKEIFVSPSASFEICAEDVAVVLGSNTDIANLRNK